MENIEIMGRENCFCVFDYDIGVSDAKKDIRNLEHFNEETVRGLAKSPAFFSKMDQYYGYRDTVTKEILSLTSRIEYNGIIFSAGDDIKCRIEDPGRLTGGKVYKIISIDTTHDEVVIIDDSGNQSYLAAVFVDKV